MGNFDPLLKLVSGIRGRAAFSANVRPLGLVPSLAACLVLL